MAANKFATMLHNNTNKITLILIYALLEWTLIILLLLHSVFSYFIIKFAQFFGLKQPCFWCARIDRFFEPENNNFGYNLCELHSKEVSRSRFCSMHQKMVKSHDMCDDCSSFDLGFRRESMNFVFSRVERIVVVHSDGEDEMNFKCCCCGVNFERKSVDDSSSFVIHPFWDILGSVKKGNSVEDRVFKDDHIESDCDEKNQSEKEKLETEEPEIELIRDSTNSFEQDLIQFEKGEDLNAHDLQFFIDYSGNQLFPFELPISKTEEKLLDPQDEDHEFGDFQKAQVNSQDFNDPVHLKTEESQNFAENLIDFGIDPVSIDKETQNPSTETGELQEEGDSDVHSVDEEEDVSIGTEIPVLDSCDEIKHDKPATKSHDLHFNLDDDFEEQNAGELKNLSRNGDESEEEKAPDTPSSMYSLNPLHKKWLTPETKESGLEESFDGSVMSEMDSDDPVNTAEKLKLALKAERKALRDLYSELEEERNASAVAANETMAMINRLQEEKATMQMEALQYQRMMEEQSEYDQEALQLLNELMLKKEKELELYRKKVADHEAKEKTSLLRRSKTGSTRTGTSSVSWSHSEEEDGSSIDLNQAPKEEEPVDQITPISSVLDLGSSLADFEEERVSILEQLKVLEERLFVLSDEEDRHFANIRVMEDHYEEIGNGQAVEDGVTVRNGYEIGYHKTDTAVTRFELEKKRIDMEEEVDQLYGRLEAVEADKELLKHCIGSMKKGEKGMEVVEEILHHLRHLRNVNLPPKNYTG